MRRPNLMYDIANIFITEYWLYFKNLSFVKLLYTFFRVNSLQKTRILLKDYKPDFLYFLKQYALKYRPYFTIILFINKIDNKLLPQVLKSIKSQRYNNWELYIVFDETNQEDLGIRKNTIIQNFTLIKSSEYNLKDKINQIVSGCNGSFILFLNQYEMLLPNFLYEYAKSINYNHNLKLIYSNQLIKNISKIYLHIKPGFGIDTIRSHNFIGCVYVIEKNIFQQGLDLLSEDKANLAYSIILSLIEIIAIEVSSFIINTNKILSCTTNDESNKNFDIWGNNIDITMDKASLENHFLRLRIDANVYVNNKLGIFRTSYIIKNTPKISIIIPNKDRVDLLSVCIESIFEKTTYMEFEIIIVENNSISNDTFEYYGRIEKLYPNLQVINFNGDFNYSTVNNYAVGFATGAYLIFLNNDIKIITPSWIEEMLMLCQRDDVGIVGAKLLYSDDTIQHAGMSAYLNHTYHLNVNCERYYKAVNFVKNVSAVTGACMMIKKDLFIKINMFDQQFVITYNDTDLCFKVRKLGYLVCYTPFSELYHFESETRGKKMIEQYILEHKLFYAKWSHMILNQVDDYSRDIEDCYANVRVNIVSDEPLAKNFNDVDVILYSSNLFVCKDKKNVIKLDLKDNLKFRKKLKEVGNDSNKLRALLIDYKYYLHNCIIK